MNAEVCEEEFVSSYDRYGTIWFDIVLMGLGLICLDVIHQRHWLFLLHCCLTRANIEFADVHNNLKI